MTEIILLSITLALLVTLIVLVLWTRKERNSTKKLDEFRSNIDGIKDNILSQLTKLIIDFNNSVNAKLLENAQSSNQSISDFRVKVNDELNRFNEKIGSKMIDEFTKLNDQVDKKMTGINEKVEQRLSKGFDTTNETFKNIIERMAVIDKAQGNIEKLSTEMVSLQTILSNNQSRGVFGEFQLNQILHASYGENPSLYQTQYTLKEAKGTKESVRADAVIFMPAPHNLICIDSKFPFANYARLFNEKLKSEEEDRLISEFSKDVKKHISDIHDKYIIEGVTATFACMFVASDGILSLLHSRCPNVIEWAALKNVVILSPTIAIPMLMSFKAIVIDYERSKNAGEIRKQLQLLSRDFNKFGDAWLKLSDTIRRLTEQSGHVDARVTLMTSQFNRIKSSNSIEEGEENQE